MFGQHLFFFGASSGHIWRHAEIEKWLVAADVARHGGDGAFYLDVTAYLSKDGRKEGVDVVKARQSLTDNNLIVNIYVLTL